MTLIRTVNPSAEPVTLAEVKGHLRLDHATEDDLLNGLIRAAREEVERTTAMALIDQSWRLTLDRWPIGGLARIKIYPVRTITSITAFGTEGEVSLIDPSTYQVDSVSRPARVRIATPMQPLRAMNGIEIDFTAGFGEAGTDVPDLLHRAILLLVAHWYEFRASFGPNEQPVSYPPGYERIVAGYRARRL